MNPLFASPSLADADLLAGLSILALLALLYYGGLTFLASRHQIGPCAPLPAPRATAEPPQPSPGSGRAPAPAPVPAAANPLAAGQLESALGRRGDHAQGNDRGRHPNSSDTV